MLHYYPQLSRTPLLSGRGQINCIWLISIVKKTELDRIDNSSVGSRGGARGARSPLMFGPS